MTTQMDRVGAAGLAITIAVAVGMVIHLSGQASQVSGDFRNAVTAEVRDAQGGVLLRGTFAAVPGDSDNEVERQATLASAEAGGTAAGNAEVEFEKSRPDVQEVEFNVTGLRAGTALTLVIDGHRVITATANGKGEAEAEVNVGYRMATPTRADQ
jgi:hypothetical protein